MEEWYIAKSKPQKEGWLTTSLAHLGVEVFFPRIASQRRGKRVTEPLFPTYLFCRFDMSTSNWPAIRWAPGLNYFLGLDGKPARIPDDLVSYVQQRVELWNEKKCATKVLHRGQRVLVAAGPFAGLEGIFEKYVSSRRRCRILLNVVGRLSPVELDQTNLEITLRSL